MTADDFGSLVAEGDLELGFLSEEEYQALWADRARDSAGGLEPEVLVALKSLLSSERAQLVDGEVVLGGFLGLIRSVVDEATIEMDIDIRDGDSVTWSPCGPVLLQREWSPPGLFRFVLRSRTRALSELATQLLPAPLSPSTTVTFTVHDLDEVSDGQDPASTTVTLLREQGAATWSGGDDGEVVDALALRRRLQHLLGG